MPPEFEKWGFMISTRAQQLKLDDDEVFFLFKIK
jgi:hypothetical protein